MLECITAIWYFYDNSVLLMTIQYILWSFDLHICSRFGKSYQEKSGNPGWMS
jgi:hypothetical protein